MGGTKNIAFGKVRGLINPFIEMSNIAYFKIVKVVDENMIFPTYYSVDEFVLEDWR